MINSKLDNIVNNAFRDIELASSVSELEFLSTKYVGRKGVLTLFLRDISSLPANDRPSVGKRANKIKKVIKSALNNAMGRVNSQFEGDNGYGEKLGGRIGTLDISLPGRRHNERGHLHPITQVTSLICDIFRSVGFEIVKGPEIETDYYNFEALNIPKNHPARDMQDTFYVSDGIVLRTHTSAAQPRIMEKTSPPIRILSPGKVYRCDSDVTHTPMFHQVEGLFVDSGISFSDLKGIISMFIRRMFGNKTRIRFRSSFFPFTEPSAEVDIACVICSGGGCRVCSQTGWLEILGSGMVHPAVFEKVGYDISKYTGFAFGMGVERIAMLKYRVDDIRKYFDNDFRFLAQF